MRTPFMYAKTRKCSLITPNKGKQNRWGGGGFCAGYGYLYLDRIYSLHAEIIVKRFSNFSILFSSHNLVAAT